MQTIIEAGEEARRAERIWVMDRGNASEANLEFLREREGHYIVGTPKQMGRQFGEI